jgi:hypothetical protein
MSTVLKVLRQTATGAYILYDWLGEGGEPVPAEQANARAKVCQGCPENRKAEWWQTAHSIIADAIMEHLAVKNELELKVENEDKIGMCRVCGCCNRMKVWSPLKHIKRHTLSETLAAFPPHCWIKTEQA